MRITGLDLENWLVHRHLSVAFTPLSLVCGPNECGKTSVADAIAFVLMASLRRISAKGDRPLLVSRGADRGHVTIRCGEADAAMAYTRDIASAKPKGGGKAIPIGAGSVAQAVPYVLDPAAFARATPDERRTLLLAVMRVSLAPAALLEALASRGHAAALLAKLPTGEPLAKWQAFADTQASEARGAWKAMTGEVYGSAKAEIWGQQQREDLAARDAAPDLTQLQVRYDALRAELATLHTEKGRVQAQAQALQNRAGQLGTLKAELVGQDLLGETLARQTAALAEAETYHTQCVMDLASLKAKPRTGMRLSCPECGSILMLLGQELQATAAIPETVGEATIMNADATMRTAKSAVTVAQAARDRTRQSLDALDRIRAQLEQLQAETPAPVDLAPVNAKIEQLEAVLEPLTDQLAEAHRLEGAAVQAAETIEAADAAHAQVKAWVAISAAVSPGGLPSELLAKALGPFNVALARIAAELHWQPIALGSDMSLSRSGLPYALLSESAQWRADIVLALALAELSGLKFIVIDRFDVLEVSARKPLLSWLYRATKAQQLHTAVVLGTLREPPAVPADVATIWLGPQLQEAAA